MRRSAALAISSLILGLLWLSGWAGASGPGPLATPSAQLFLPLVNREATFTPTLTPTPTATPSPTPTSTAAPTQGPHGIVGQLALCNPQTVYPVGGTICVVELIRNTTNVTVTYGILGVSVAGQAGAPSWFQTSWSGDLAIGPGCFGPTDTCGGAWQDHIRGDGTPGFATPGTYVLSLSMCYSTVSACTQPGAVWEVFTPGVTVTVVN